MTLNVHDIYIPMSLIDVRAWRSTVKTSTLYYNYTVHPYNGTMEILVPVNLEAIMNCSAANNCDITDIANVIFAMWLKLSQTSKHLQQKPLAWT